ncbi:MAG: hypothetical protein PVF17_00995 [Ignavibacteria bacterium]|jgi:hypothetical protein
MTATNKIVLFEYDIPVDRTNMLNYEAGIWFWTITPGDVTVLDNYGMSGYYNWTNTLVYNIKSFRYDDIFFSRTTSLDDCRQTENSFYYDEETTYLYIRREDYEPVLTDNMIIGVAVGYSYKENIDCYYNNQYYEPLISKMFAIKKSIDPLFYGLLKYQSGEVTFINNGGEFDDWRSRNLFKMASRVLIGDYGDSYSDLVQRYSGFIENDKKTFTEFSLTVQDPRKGLTQGIATNLLNQTDYPDLSDSNVDVSKPVAYGVITNAPTYCLNEEESGSPSSYTFIFADTTYNNVTSIEEIRVNKVVKTPTSTDLAAGTFVLSSSDVGDNFDEVKIDFTVNTKNGINIIKDLMLNYDNKPYLGSFFDISEIDDAEIDCRDTSLYIEDSDLKLSEAIESICKDCDIRFFVKDNGKYTARIYDADRTPAYTIQKDDWMGDPSIINNGSEFLTSVRIGYKHDIDNDERLYYENIDYRDNTFKIYKSYKTRTYETELTTLADAQDKSETIMEISSNINDIVERTTHWAYADIEPTDFIIANPTDRVSSTVDNWGIYEILNVTKSLENFTVKLKMRFVKAYTPIETEINVFVDENGDYFTDENGDYWIEEIIL